jgi:KDO2-lipid IV(A) lauroyltransferase
MQFLVLLSTPFSLDYFHSSLSHFYWLSDDGVYFYLYYRLSESGKSFWHYLILAIRKEYNEKSYHHLCDMFMEMIKTIWHIVKEMNKRFVITNIELIKEYEQKKASCF